MGKKQNNTQNNGMFGVNNIIFLCSQLYWDQKQQVTDQNADTFKAFVQFSPHL